MSDQLLNSALVSAKPETIIQLRYDALSLAAHSQASQADIVALAEEYYRFLTAGADALLVRSGSGGGGSLSGVRRS